MDRPDILNGLVWYRVSPDNAGGSLDGLYAAQGESVQVPAQAPPLKPAYPTPARANVRIESVSASRSAG